MSIGINATDAKDKSLTPITERETFEFFVEGLRQASSAAMQMSRLQNHPIWADVSELLDEIHNHGVSLWKSKPMSRFDVLQMIDGKQKKSVAALDESRPQKLIIN